MIFYICMIHVCIKLQNFQTTALNKRLKILRFKLVEIRSSSNHLIFYWRGLVSHLFSFLIAFNEKFVIGLKGIQWFHNVNNKT